MALYSQNPALKVRVFKALIIDAKIGSDFWPSTLTNWAHFFHGAIESQALHEVSTKRFTSKVFKHLESIENMGPSTASIGKNLSNLSPHQPATGLGGSILTSIIDALKVRICRAGFWLKKAKIRKKPQFKKVLSSSLLKQYQYLDQPKNLPKFLFQLRELMLEIKSVSTESFFINYLYNNSKTTEQSVLKIYSL